MNKFQEDDAGVRVGDKVFYVLGKKSKKYHRGKVTAIIGSKKVTGGYGYAYEIDGIYIIL